MVQYVLMRYVFLLLLVSTLGAKEILVTGGAGLIGSNLCRDLLEQGHSVVCLDNLSSGLTQNIERLEHYQLFTFIEGDICDPFEYEGPIDEVYNLACPASPVFYQKDPVQTLRTSFVGVENMLKFARVKGAKFLQTSTSEVYGDPQEHPQREAYWGHVNPIGVRACYDEGKRVAEALILAYHQQYGLDVKIVRIFNTYGPNMNQYDGRVIPNFIDQALKGQDLTIYGDGLQTRSFCFVDDMVAGLEAMMQQDSQFTGPVNLGNPTEMTMIELAQRVIELTQSKSKIIFMPLPQDDPKLRRPDITVAKRKLGWEPQTPVRDGILSTIDYFKSL